MQNRAFRGEIPRGVDAEGRRVVVLLQELRDEFHVAVDVLGWVSWLAKYRPGGGFFSVFFGGRGSIVQQRFFCFL